MVTTSPGINNLVVVPFASLCSHTEDLWPDPGLFGTYCAVENRGRFCGDFEMAGAKIKRKKNMKRPGRLRNFKREAAYVVPPFMLILGPPLRRGRPINDPHFTDLGVLKLSCMDTHSLSPLD
jgi:hypothetical protein